MVTRRRRRRRKKPLVRVKKYKKKFSPREVNLAFKENIGFYVPNLEEYLRVDALLEKEVLELLKKNVELGLIKEEEKDLYLAFWRKVRELGQDYSGKTLENEIKLVIGEFILRGLVKEKLEEIVELVKDQLERKKFYHELKEFAVLQDYLKFKALAYVIKPVYLTYEFLPLTDFVFSYIIRPLAYRVFTLKPQKAFQFIRYVLPTLTRVFTLNLRDGFTLQFLYEVSRYLTFVFSSLPLKKLLFDYDVSAPQFRRFILTITMSYEFEYSVFPSLIRILSLRPIIASQLLYSVRPVPYRVFEIKRIPRLLFSAYANIPKLVERINTPLKRVLFLAYAPPTSKQQRELKPIQRVEFIYSIRPR